MAKEEIIFFVAPHRSGLALSLTADELNQVFEVIHVETILIGTNTSWNVKNIEQFALFLCWNPMLLIRNRNLW